MPPEATAAEAVAALHEAELRRAEDRLQAAQSQATTEQLRQRLDQLSLEEPGRTRTKNHDLGAGLLL